MAELKNREGNAFIDDEGYLLNTDDWNENVARVLAKREGIVEISDDMLEIVKFLRQYFQKHKSFPILNYVCKNIHQPRECVSEQFINPMKAWKIAGLPKLDGIHFVSLDGKHYTLEECC